MQALAHTHARTRAPSALTASSSTSRPCLSQPLRTNTKHVLAQRRQGHALRAKTPNAEEEKEIEKMKQEASGSSPLENEGLSIGIKVAVISIFVGLSIGMAKLGEPIIQATISRFPSPGDY